MDDRNTTDVDEFFAGRDRARQIYERVAAVIMQIGPATTRVSKSQIAFRRKTGFASVWTPDRYLSNTDVPLVLTVLLRRRDTSGRWKEVVEPGDGRFTHHMELREPEDVDQQVAGWLEEAWKLAG